jgi:hypothetical protein
VFLPSKNNKKKEKETRKEKESRGEQRDKNQQTKKKIEESCFLRVLNSLYVTILQIFLDMV